MPDPEVLPGDSQVAPEAAKPAPETVDYQALYQTEKAAREQAEAAARKLERDHAALRGSVRAQAIRDAEIADRFDTLGNLIVSVAKGSGDEDVLKEVTSTQTASRQQAEQARFQARWGQLNDELKSVLVDETGKPVLDLAAAPELADVRGLYQESYSGTDASGRQLSSQERLERLHDAALKAHKLMLDRERAARKTIEKPVEKSTEKPKPEAKKPLPDMSVGSANGAGGAMSDEEFKRAYGRGEVHDHKRYLELTKKK